MDRTNTNYRVYLNAACILSGKETENALLPLSEQWSQRRKRLMSFLLSPRTTQPEIKATFYFPPAFEFSPVEAINSLWPNISNLVRRRGRPRGQWVREIIAELWRDIRHADPNLPNLDVETQHTEIGLPTTWPQFTHFQYSLNRRGYARGSVCGGPEVVCRERAGR